MTTRQATPLLLPRIVCTSTTRPPNPAVGQEIYETDTGKTLYYQSATTLWTPPWNISWGIIGLAEVTANQSFGTVVGNYDVTGLSITATIVANRRIRVTAQGQLASTVQTDGLQLLILQDGTVVQIAAEANAQPMEQFPARVLSPAAGSHTWKVQIGKYAGTGTLTFGASASAVGFICVEDLGSNGAPV